MNNRDPFGLRNSSALPLIETGFRIAARHANSVKTQLQETAQHLTSSNQDFGPSQTSLDPTAAADQSRRSGAMASSQMHSSRESTSSQWQPRRHANSWAGYGQKVMNQISPKEENGLPLYKDKPVGYTGAGGHGSSKLPIWRKQRVILIALLGFAAFFYWFQFFSPSPPLPTPLNESEAPKKGHRKGPLETLIGTGTTKGKKVDWEARKESVRDAFKISWDAYEKYAWGFDEFHPISKTGRQMVPNGFGWTIVDALDTMIIMNLTTQLTHARDWVSTTLNYNQDHDVNTFETTIRMLGGLLSAHYLSTAHPNWAPVAYDEGGEDLYLEKATDLADRLLGAYDSRSGIPYASVNLATRKGIPSHDDGGASSTAEAASLQLEMKYLAKLTGEKNYWDAAENVIKLIDDNGRKDGLLPIFIYAETAEFRGDNIRLGSRGDSYYEYLIKQYLQTSEQEPIYKDLWDEALLGIQKHLITYTRHANLAIIGEKPTGLNGPLFPKMDHLVCFMPGTIALGATGGRTLAEAKRDPSWGSKQEQEMELARQLTKTCWGMYKVTATGLSPEIAHFRIHDPPHMMADGIPDSPDLDDQKTTNWHMDYEIHANDYHNVQRPETVETLFYMWRITQDPIYREWGWQMFESFVQHTAVPDGGGFSSINHVDKLPVSFRDNMESFWLAETLKYFYLLFGPEDVLPLDEIVLNTEAHPLPRFELGKLFSTGWKRKPRDAEGNLIPTA